MSEQARRGYAPNDAREFSAESLQVLRRAQEDVALFLNRGYEIGRCVTFVGDHYQLSARQRMAIRRATAGSDAVRSRRVKEKPGPLLGQVLLIDGFNLIIPIEIALSGGTLLLCMDGAVRDLAGLHGTYRMIGATDDAIRLIGGALEKCGAAQADFYFDSPVSNAGRLAQRVREDLAGRPFSVSARTDPHVDGLLARRENVVTGDSVILDGCISWVNLARAVLRDALPDYPLVDLSVVNTSTSPRS